MSKKFTLVVVRHGEATHNLPDFKPENLVLTNDPEMPFLNNPLTEKGFEQAGRLAERLAREKFNLVLASDLARAWDTAQAIVKENPSVDNVQELRELRERNAGVLNGEREIFRCQLKVEEAIEDRQLKIPTWKIPGGESVVDLRKRVEAFLQLLLAKAQEQKEVEDLKILVVTHFMWMHELYMILVSMVGGEMQKKPRTPNTGLDQYTLTARTGEDGKAKLEQVVFDVISCGKHLTQG